MPLRRDNNFAASLVLLAHFAFVLLAVFGGLGLLINPTWAWVHVPIVVWSSVVNLAGWTCPLTPLENRLRVAATGTGYEGRFVQHYIGPLVYPRHMPRQLELVAGVTMSCGTYYCMAAFFGGNLVAPRPPNRSFNTDASQAALRAVPRVAG